jgi:hypothetical protein
MHPDYRTNQPRFSLRRLLICTALIAAGIPTFAFYATNDDDLVPPWLNSVPIFYLIWFGSGACIGVGAFGLFKRPWTGAIVGCLGALAGLAYVVWDVVFDMP